MSTFLNFIFDLLLKINIYIILKNILKQIVETKTKKDLSFLFVVIFFFFSEREREREREREIERDTHINVFKMVKCNSGFP